MIVSEIVDSIKTMSSEGGFVRSVDNTWWVVSDHIAREKTGQAFRDALHSQYRSSTRAKRRRQREREKMTGAAAKDDNQGSEGCANEEDDDDDPDICVKKGNGDDRGDDPDIREKASSKQGEGKNKQIVRDVQTNALIEEIDIPSQCTYVCY